MNPAEILTLCLSAAGLLIAGGGWWLNARQHARATSAAAEDRGAAANRLQELERWRENRSIDRPEFDALAARVAGVEGDVREVCKQVADVSRQVAVSDARLVGMQDLMKAQGEAISHQLRNLRMAVDGAAGVRRREDA